MIRKPVSIDDVLFPASFAKYMQGASLYDSSCSPEARVTFIDAASGYYLKRSPKGTLQNEAVMTDYFHKKRLSCEVLEYVTEANYDYLLTRKINGEDCTHTQYRSDPKRLCDTLAELLRTLHETDFSFCPIQNRCASYVRTVLENNSKGLFDPSYLARELSSLTKEEAFCEFEKGASLLKSDTLIHGDYCLPNVMLDDWRFSAFIDLGNGGVGDRHIDLFWGAWTLNFNLHTDVYRDRFFDAYGRDLVDDEILKIVSIAEAFG